MIDVRCPRCSKTKETLELDKKMTFSSSVASTVCSDCKIELQSKTGRSAEDKLVQAILGENILGWEVEEDEVTKD